MVLIYVAIGIGILILVVLLYKAKKTGKHDYLKMDNRCQVCGNPTNGLKCPNCERKKSFGV